MDVTYSTSDAAVWWGCSDCGIEVELPASETAGFLQPCPDCPGSLQELWRWESSHQEPRRGERIAA